MSHRVKLRAQLPGGHHAGSVDRQQLLDLAVQVLVKAGREIGADQTQEQREKQNRPSTPDEKAAEPSQQNVDVLREAPPHPQSNDA